MSSASPVLSLPSLVTSTFLESTSPASSSSPDGSLGAIEHNGAAYQIPHVPFPKPVTPMSENPELAATVAKVSQVAAAILKAGPRKQVLLPGWNFRTMKRLTHTVLVDPKNANRLTVVTKQRLGAGTFKQVFEAQCTQELGPSAVAVISKKLLTKEKLSAENIVKELGYKILFGNAPEIAGSVRPVRETEDDLYFEMPRYLCDWLNYRIDHCHKNALPLNHLLPAIKDVLRGLALLHEQNFVHRDIKPENLFMYLENDTLRAAIGDLGFVRSLNDDTTAHTTSGTMHYISPENLFEFKLVGERRLRRENIQKTTGDMWALGITLYQMVAKENCELYASNYNDSRKNYSDYESWKANASPQFLAILKRNLPRATPAESALSDFIIRLLDWDPAKRPTAAQALEELAPLFAAAEQAARPPA